MKKVSLFLVIFVLGVLAGCGSESSTSGSDEKETNGGQEITIWAWDPKFNIAAFDLAESYYQEDHPDFSINVTEISQQDSVQKMNTIFSSGGTQGLPNIVLIEDFRIRNFLEVFPEYFVPLTDYINVEDFMDYKIEVSSVDGEQYGMPFDSGVAGVYLRKSIIEESGLAINDFHDISWQTFNTLGMQVKEATGKPLFSIDMNDLAHLRMMMHSSGYWYTTEDGETPFIDGNPSLKQGFEDLKMMLDSGVITTHNGWDQLLAGFNSGDVAGVLQGNWITPSVKSEDSHSGDWVVVPVPKQENIDTSVHATNLGGSSIYVLDIDGKEEALHYISEVFGKNIAFYEELVQTVGAIGSYIPASEGEAYKATDPFFDNQPIYQDFVTWATEIPSVNFGKNTYALEDIMNPVFLDYVNGADLAEGLKNAQTIAENQLN